MIPRAQAFDTAAASCAQAMYVIGD
jgi:hypothetical protein